MPGYGLAVAQAQHTIHELAEMLQAARRQVIYGIHPVAGRMPGHMNVLLAEANVPYEQLKEMDEANSELPLDRRRAGGRRQRRRQPGRADQPGSPDLRHADPRRRARRTPWCSSSGRCGPGFAGIENELLYEPKTTLLFGDAKDSLTKVLQALKPSEPRPRAPACRGAWVRPRVQ